MPVAQTSIATYRDLLNTGKINGQHFTIVNAMIEHTDYSRRDLVKLTGLEINAVCGRVNDLIKQGALIEVYCRPDNTTGRQVKVLRLNTGEVQASLF